MIRQPMQLGDTFRIDYANSVRWRSQKGMAPSVAPYTPPGSSDRFGGWNPLTAMGDESWVAPLIEAGGQVASSVVTQVGEGERAKAEAEAKAKKAKKAKAKAKKAGKASASSNTAVDAVKRKKGKEEDEPSSIPWGPLAVGAAALLIGGALLLRKPQAPATPAAPASQKEGGKS